MFVRGSIVFPGEGLYSAGDDGYYWSSVSRNSDRAYNLYFNSGLVSLSSHNDRHQGFSVRCVALGG